jgi:uncharacterized protein YtpQ (UPF0354 family)
MEDVGGRLVPAARAFVDSQRPPLPGNGPTGIRWLASQLEAFVDQDSNDADDDRFVEGAGAVLGLLLIDHLGGRTREKDGCHRVQLGRFGWFDPFGTVQDALDAEDPRGCLSDYLSVAEREAAEDGPVSRVVRVFADALGRERPDLDIESQFELTLDLNNGASVDLARLERVSRDQDDDAATEAARRIISMLPGANTQEETPWVEAATRLLPRLVSTKFLESLPGEQSLYSDEVGDGVHLALQLRYGERARYVRSEEVDSWAPERAATRQQALENLAAKSGSLRLQRVSPEILRIRQGDGLDGARLLLPDLARRLALLEGGLWVAAAPHRDVLLLARGEAIEALHRRAEDAVRRAPHPVSAAIFAITAQGPRPLRR